jgi:hypothetical protein
VRVRAKVRLTPPVSRQVSVGVRPRVGTVINLLPLLL